MDPDLLGWTLGSYGPAVFQFASEATGERDILERAQRNIAYACDTCGITIVTGEAWLP